MGRGHIAGARRAGTGRGRAVRSVAGLALALAVCGEARAAGPDPAIGRLNYAGYRDVRHCTMFAVADRTVVTAAHCLSGVDSGALHLLFGYAQMEWAAHLDPVSGEELPQDVAVLCIDEAAPGQLAVSAEVGTEVRVVGYGIPTAHRQQTAVCGVIGRDEDEVLMDCPLAPGASGAPVLNAAGEAVAVVSRSGKRQSIATLLPRDLAGRCR